MEALNGVFTFPGAGQPIAVKFADAKPQDMQRVGAKRGINMEMMGGGGGGPSKRQMMGGFMGKQGGMGGMGNFGGMVRITREGGKAHTPHYPTETAPQGGSQLHPGRLGFWRFRFCWKSGFMLRHQRWLQTSDLLCKAGVMLSGQMSTSD